MSTSAPAFSSNNPFRRQQEPGLAVDLQPPPFLPADLPPRRASPAVPPPRRSSNDTQSTSIQRNALPITRRGHHSVSPSQPCFPTGSFHSSQPEKHRQGSFSSGPTSYPRTAATNARPVSTFYTHTKYSSSDQSLFRSHDSEIPDYNRRPSAPSENPP